MRGKWHEKNSGSFFESIPTKVSNQIPMSASGAKAAITVASGDYVWQVGVLADGVLVTASTTFDVGDGGRADRFMDAVVSIATNDIILSPTIHSASNVATSMPTLRTDEVHGHRYTANDTIDVTITNSKATSGGSVRVIAWISNELP